ncbi:hypothetical protein AKO1_007667 [Acrasis kona]|uniref:UPF3 domain-containing protein n=1 Tax=Acrasis kona TaxID=1008807 RepID=A0AAW2YRC5_9EUKA
MNEGSPLIPTHEVSGEGANRPKLPSSRGRGRGRGTRPNQDAQAPQQTPPPMRDNKPTRGKPKPRPTSRDATAGQQSTAKDGAPSKHEVKEAQPLGSRKRNKTKLVVRNLPYNLKEENFIQQLPQRYKMPPTFVNLHPSIIDWFYYASGTTSNLYTVPSVAYLNFVNTDEVFRFTDDVNLKTFSVVTIDSNNDTSNDDSIAKNELKCLVEYAPFQKISNDTKGLRDPRMNTIEQDEDYISFQESLNKKVQKTIVSAEKQLELSQEKDRELLEASGGVLPEVSTPLLDSLINKSNEKKKKNAGAPKNKRRDSTNTAAPAPASSHSESMPLNASSTSPPVDKKKHLPRKRFKKPGVPSEQQDST